MPFDTTAGRAVLLDNICSMRELANRLDVSYETVRRWRRDKNDTAFPEPLPFSRNYYDYAEVYEWYRGWVMSRPKHFPKAVIAMLQESVTE